MSQLVSLWQMNQYLESQGYDIFPFKLDNNKYKVALWRNDSFIDYGKIEYKTWKLAVDETIKVIYNKIKK